MPDTKEKYMPEESMEYSFSTITKVISFLQMFMPETLAKRIICIVLLAVGISPKEVAQISGFCTKTVTKIKNKMDKNETDGLFTIKGGGRKSILAEVETEIVNEVLQNQYHGKQQIADMIQEKFGIKVTPQCVGKLLKKTASDV
jgi:transposase